MQQYSKLKCSLSPEKYKLLCAVFFAATHFLQDCVDAYLSVFFPIGRNSLDFSDNAQYNKGTIEDP